MIFNATDYQCLHRLFSSSYKGYKPEVREIPNGDGKVDVGKRYLHVALKYDPPEWAVKYLARAHFEACRVAEELEVPDEYYPRVQDGTLRVLEYPPGVGGAEHTDFDLFTVNCYRNSPENLVSNDGRHAMHIGEIGELVRLGPATSHYVTPSHTHQYSIVYFAMCSHAALLPSKTMGMFEQRTSIGSWLTERYARSRVSMP